MKASQVAKRLGVDFEYVTDHDGPQWDGQKLWLETGDDDVYFFHELVHWVVASEKERSKWNFGLGPDATWGFRNGYDSLRKNKEGRYMYPGHRLVSKDRATEMETNAIDGFFLAVPMLGISMEKAWDFWAEFGGNMGRDGLTAAEMADEINPVLEMIAEKFTQFGLRPQDYLLTEETTRSTL